jgi:hypothetical protein
MYKRTFIRKLVAAMIVGVGDSLSLWQTISGFSSESHNKWIWLASTIAVFVAFCAIVIWWWYSEFKRAETLEEKRPTVHVLPQFKGGMAWLTVKNTGSHEAKFGVNITLFGIKLNPEDDNMSYDAKWKDMRDTPLNLIIPDQTCSVVTAQTKGMNLDNDEGIYLFTAFETKQGIVPFDSTMKCEVQITSAPQLKHQFVKRYILSIDEKRHQWAGFSEEVKP